VVRLTNAMAAAPLRRAAPLTRKQHWQPNHLRADFEHRSMQEVARQAIREYVESHSRADLLDRVLDEELPRYAEALERLGQ
jgi:hypothetical protein